MAAIEKNTVTYDILEARVDYSEKYLQPREVEGIFNVMGTGASLVNTEFHWWETYLPPRTTTLSAAYTAGDGTLTVTSTEPFSVGSIIGAAAISFRVTAINLTTKVLTVVVVDGTDADIADASTVTVLSNANVESADSGVYQRKDKTKNENVSQILREVISISGSSLELGKEVAGAEAQEALAVKIQKMRRDMATMPWSAFKVAPTDNTGARIAGGIPYFIAQNGYTTSGALTQDNLDAFIEYVYNTNGGVPTELWINPSVHQTISKTFDATAFRRDMEGEVRGTVATKYVTGTGREVMLKTDVNIPAAKMYVMNSSDVVWRPYRPMRSEPLGKKGDYLEIELLTEISMEINPSAQMGEYTIV